MADGGSGRMRWPVRRRAGGSPDTVEDIAARDIGDFQAPERELPPPPLESVPMADPPPRLNLAAFRLAALGLALVLTLALTMVKLFVVGPPSLAQLRAQAGVDGWTELTIGVKDDQPGIAYYDPQNKKWSGFDIDIAHMIAEDLGFREQEVKFYAIESEDRPRMQATDPSNDNRRVAVKMVIASFSITAERAATGILFSAPYLYTEQSVMTLPDHPRVSSLADLKGKKVCSLSTSTSASALKTAEAIVISKNRVSDCFAMLDRHQLDAISTDAAILGGYKARHPSKYAHWDIGLEGSEKYGVNVGSNKALQTLVDVTLYRSWTDPHDERWENAFQNLQNEVDANLPTPLAVAEQPPVARPKVRQLPWESELP
jgi:glutamate transport system substrate-binding protein